MLHPPPPPPPQLLSHPHPHPQFVAATSLILSSSEIFFTLHHMPGGLPQFPDFSKKYLIVIERNVKLCIIVVLKWEGQIHGKTLL